MLTDLEEIKRRLRSGRHLSNGGNGWFMMRASHRYGKPISDEVPADLVALLTAQGFISTELRVVGEARWVG